MPRLPEALREELQSDTRQRLLEAAAAEFAEHGFSAANINRISLAAGFAKGTIYNYFPSKRELMLALIDEIAARHSAFIVERIEGEREPAAALREFFSAGFDFVHEHPVQTRIAISAVFNHDAEFRERIFDAYADLYTTLGTGVLEAGVAAGQFEPMDVDSTLALLMSIYLGSCSLANEEGQIGFDPDYVASFVIEGIGLSPEKELDWETAHE